MQIASGHVITRVIAAIAAVSAATSLWAQTYPAKPVRMIVPFTPGGSQDVIARLFAQKLTESLKQQVVIDNRGGAAGLIAAELVAHARHLKPTGFRTDPARTLRGE